MLDTELRRKLAWLIAVRAIVSTILLGSATLIELTSSGSFPIQRLFLLIGLTYALTIFYAVTLRYADRIRALVDVQLASDALIVSAFIYLTGGITSYFSLLYLLPIVAGSTVQLRRGGLLAAILSTALYVAIVLTQYRTAGPPFHSGPIVELPSHLVAEYTVAVNIFCFFAVALLSGSLAEELHSTSAGLVQASTEIADLQALNQHVINSLPSGLVTTDPEQRILTFNRAAASITGVEWTSAVGRPIGDVLQLPASILGSFDQNARADWRTRRYECPYHTADRRGEIELGMSITHLETAVGRAGFLVTFQDVTVFKRMERDQAMQQRLAAVGEMAAGIAHEIRNPLASMSGSIQILRQELPLSEEQEQLMDIVLRESDRLNTTIRSFLAYARPQRFAMSRLDVRRALRDAALLLRNSPEVNDQHVVEVDLPPHELWYDADEGQIKQIVWNLATNGIRAMPDGGQLRLTGTADPSSGGVVITVQDQGIGMAPEQLDGLFQPFHGGFAKGSGLGLAIVHRIVTDYKGEIQVRSRSGAGTTVSVRLPAQRPVAVA